MNLRPYQKQAIDDCRKSISEKNQRTILCAPTGSGKTVMFSEIVNSASKKGTQSLILTDRIELFTQTLKAIGGNPQLLNAKKSAIAFNPHALVTVAMVETLKRRVLFGFNPKLIIVDEAHKGNFNKVFEIYPDALVLGCTATPVGKHLFKYYQNIVQTIDIPELIDLGFLSPCRAYQMQDDFSDLQTKAGEYTDSSLFNHFNNRKLYSGVITEWLKYAENKKTIVFNVNIEHTIEMDREFNNSGISSEYITSKTSKVDRERILEGFKRGDFKVLNNCGILTTGYDEPSIEVVIMNRKTKSLPLWLQCCGRGSRIYNNKEYFTILDFGMNHDEHGMWSEPRNWKLEKPKKKAGEGVAPIKNCKKCDAVNYASAKKCNVCGEVFPVKEEEISEGVMVEQKPNTPIDLVGRRISDLSIDELIELQKSKKYKASFIWRVVRNLSSSEKDEYQNKMGYTKGWRYRQDLEINNDYNNYILR